MKRVLYVGENPQIGAILHPDWTLGTCLLPSDASLHELIQEAVLNDCDIVLLQSPAVLSEFQDDSRMSWQRIKQYASSYMDATGWFVDLFQEADLVMF